MRIEVAAAAPGAFDLLAVSGHASLAGTLQLGAGGTSGSIGGNVAEA